MTVDCTAGERESRLVDVSVDILDAQVHLFERGPRVERVDAMLGDRDAEMRKLVLAHYSRATLSGSAFVREMEDARVGRAIVVTSSVIYDDNVYPLACLREWPERLRIVGIVDATRPDIESVLGDWRSQPGIVGVRLGLLGKARREALQAGAFDAFMRGARRGGLTVCLFVQDFPEGIARLAARFPDIQFVVDHLGIHVNPLAPSSAPLDALPGICRLLAPLPNIAMKLGNVPSLSDEAPPFRDLWPRLDPLLESFGADRVLWASDRSWYPDMPYRVQVDALRDNEHLSQGDRQWLLGGTASRVFGWPAPAKQR